MISPAALIDNLVGLLRDIPDLVDAVDGDEERIFAYHDMYPKRVSLNSAKYQMPSPGVMVAYEGVDPGRFGGFEAWEHQLSLTVRAGAESDNEAPAGYYRFLRLIVKGVPTGKGVPLNYLTIHDSFQPFGAGFRMHRQTDAAGIDYFEILIFFTEIGDD